jgi:hypothetical protein
MCGMQGSCSLAQAGLKPMILLPLPPACWYYRHVPPGLAYVQNFEVPYHIYTSGKNLNFLLQNISQKPSEYFFEGWELRSNLLFFFKYIANQLFFVYTNTNISLYLLSAW